MTDQSAQEPTMEEILASIRRIISEDDAPAAEAAPEVAPEPFAAPAPELEPTPVALVEETPPAPEPAPVEEDVLDLTEVYQAPAAETIGDLDVSTPGPEPEPYTSAYAAPEPVAAAPAAYDALVGESASASAASAFAGLAASFARPDPVAETGGTGPTIDELARALLRPMLKDWLDANLPGIVEAAVRKEVERIARSAG